MSQRYVQLSWKSYAILALILVGSLALTSLFPAGDAMKILSGVPGVFALIGALFQLIRDEGRFQKDLALQQERQHFELGAASHMANVAFDKHVLFCEEYISEMYETVSTLFKEGPSALALTHAGNLYRIQRRHAAWLTPTIEKQLEPFELALRQIGAGAHMYTIDPANANSRGAVDRMYDVFSDVAGVAKDSGKPVNADIAVTSILAKLRSVLGIEALTTLRQRILSTHVSGVA